MAGSFGGQHTPPRFRGEDASVYARLRKVSFLSQIRFQIEKIILPLFPSDLKFKIRIKSTQDQYNCSVETLCQMENHPTWFDISGNGMKAQKG